MQKLINVSRKKVVHKITRFLPIDFFNIYGFHNTDRQKTSCTKVRMKFSSYGCLSTRLDFFAFARGCGTRPKIRYFGPPQACTRDETPCGLKLSADAFGLFLNMSKGHVKHIKQIPKKNILHSILLPDRILPLGGP